jgi:hypothetical protein
VRFDCGETYCEKVEREAKWHRWFAWRPVRIGSHDCRWLETVERRRDPPGYFVSLYGPIKNIWEYRATGN